MNTKETLSLEVGDVIFIRAGSELFCQVSSATDCWSNHVGLIIGHDGTDYVVAESRVPLSCTTHLSKFIGRSINGQYAVRRLSRSLTRDEHLSLSKQAICRKNILYHTGFNLESSRQFCSKFVYEVYRDALSIELGKVETFSDLLLSNPAAQLNFWRIWFFGNIPWKRKTITPASLYNCPQLITVAEAQLS